MSKSRRLVEKILEDLESEYKKLISERDPNNIPIGLSELFRDLENKSKNIQYDYATANEPINRPRNRYYNVLPHEKTRFVCESLPYINANFVKDKYILTQGPMKTYIKDFWTMVWESKADTIICLANQIENYKRKFDMYYDDTKGRNYFNFHVDVQTVNKDNVYNIITRKIKVTKSYFEFRPVTEKSQNVDIVEIDKESRIIDQIHYIGWPDNGVPTVAADILHILSLISNKTDKPIIVHCSAGIGRSGTFVVIKEILDKIGSILCEVDINETYKINIPELIFELRGYRQGLVQSVYQLDFCYSSVISGIKAMLNESNNRIDK